MPRLTKEQREYIRDWQGLGVPNDEIKDRLQGMGISDVEISIVTGIPLYILYTQTPEVKERIGEHISEYRHTTDVKDVKDWSGRDKYQYRFSELMKILDEVPVIKIFGEDFSNEILDVYMKVVRVLGRGKTEVGRRRTKLAATTYRILRKMGEPITFADIAELFSVEKKYLIRSYKEVDATLGRVPLPDVETYIGRSVTSLGLTEYVERAATNFYGDNKDVLKRFSPPVAAGASVYHTGKESGAEVTQYNTASSLSVTYIALRKALEELKKSGII